MNNVLVMNILTTYRSKRRYDIVCTR